MIDASEFVAAALAAQRAHEDADQALLKMFQRVRSTRIESGASVTAYEAVDLRCVLFVITLKKRWPNKERLLKCLHRAIKVLANSDKVERRALARYFQYCEVNEATFAPPERVLHVIVETDHSYMKAYLLYLRHGAVYACFRNGVALHLMSDRIFNRHFAQKAPAITIKNETGCDVCGSHRDLFISGNWEDGSLIVRCARHSPEKIRPQEDESRGLNYLEDESMNHARTRSADEK